MKFLEILLPLSFILTDICRFFAERKIDYFFLFLDLLGILLLLHYLYSVIKEHNENKKIKM